MRKTWERGFFLTVTCFWLGGGTQAEVTTFTKPLAPTLTLVWQKTIEHLDEVSMSRDGQVILASCRETLPDRMSFKRWRLLLDATGKLIRRDEGRGGQITGDGLRVVGQEGIETREGTLINPTPFVTNEQGMVVLSPDGTKIAIHTPGELNLTEPTITVYNGLTGERLWIRKEEDRNGTIVAAFPDEQNVVIASCGKIIWCDALSGHERWVTTIPDVPEEKDGGLVSLQATKDEGGMYYHFGSQQLIRFNSSGAIMWSHQAVENGGGSNITHDGRWVLGNINKLGQSGKLHGVDGQVGDVLWEEVGELASRVCPTLNNSLFVFLGLIPKYHPSIRDPIVVETSLGKKSLQLPPRAWLYGLDPRTGNLKWAIKTSLNLGHNQIPQFSSRPPGEYLMLFADNSTLSVYKLVQKP